MIVLLIIATLLSMIYPIWIYHHIGIPSSLTYAYRQLQETSWIFQAALILIALFAMPECIEAGKVDILIVLSCAALVVAAIKLEGKEHSIATTICCLCAIVWQIFNGGWILLLVMSVIGIMLMFWENKWVLWMELVAIYSTIGNLWILLAN